MKLIVTDLDNTLYDWVTYFGVSFNVMLEEICTLLDTEASQVINEFKTINQKYHNTEHPYSALELPSLRAQFPGADNDDLRRILEVPFSRFNRTREATLLLYPTVKETMAKLFENGHVIVGHTEATVPNAYGRISRLGVDRFMKQLYALESPPRYKSNKPKKLRYVAPADFVTHIPFSERKPNPQLLLDICNREGISPADSYYVGDSITRDMSMAKNAGVTAIWARYGKNFSEEVWSSIVRVTHWTDEDVARERRLQEEFGAIKPDYVIDEFSEILDIIG